MRRPLSQLRPFGPFVSTDRGQDVSVTILVGTESGLPAFGSEKQMFEDNISSNLERNIDDFDSQSINFFIESIVAQELKPESLGMGVIKVHDPSYTVSDAESDKDTIEQVFEDIMFNVEKIYIEQGDYFA